MLRRSAALALVVATSLGASACGTERGQKDDLAAAETEALYRNLSGLKYQVQISRQLNPADPTDKAYFANVDPAEATLEKGEAWFGVFVRVENEYDRTIPAAEEFRLEDTQGNEWEPVPSENTFAYAAGEVPPGGYIPNPESLQAQVGTQGALLLFKVPYAAFDNRPLELLIQSPEDTEKMARIDLDV